jgi:hypothetical protein
MASDLQPSAKEQAATDSTWGDHFGFGVWLASFLLIGLHCLLNLVSGLWGQ